MDPALLDILVCPITHSRLRQEGDTLVSEVGGLRYPIKDGLPVLLPDAAVVPPGTTLDAIRAAAKKNNAATTSSGQSPPNA